MKSIFYHSKLENFQYYSPPSNNSKERPESKHKAQRPPAQKEQCNGQDCCPQAG